MDKFCVFCGNKPEKKNKEHIIPKWLVKLTGDENRTAYWGVDYQDVFAPQKEEIKGRKYSFMNFAFPACMKCNSIYGDELEGKAKDIIVQILDGYPISEDEVVTLLDWFDKIRVGLWLGYLYYNKDMAVKPKFHISSRIGKSDRALYVYKTSDKKKGINFFGPGTPLFSNFPMFLGLRVNEYFFINISKDNLVLENLGFSHPTPDKVAYDKDGNFQIAGFTLGTKLINQGFYKTIKLMETDIMVYQPIYEKFLPMYREIDKAGFDSELSRYIEENSYNREKGLGKVFVYEEGYIKPMMQKKYSFEPSKKYTRFSALMKMISLNISKLLVVSAEDMVESLIEMEDTENIVKEMKRGIEYEKMLMKMRRERIEEIY